MFPVPENKTLMIDVSHFRTVDYTLLPEEVKVVLIKATEGTWFVDDKMEEHADKALASGRMIGFYHFHRTKVGGKLIEPIAQAEFYLETTLKYHNQMVIDAWDFENPFFINGDLNRPYNPKVGNEQASLKKSLMTVKAARDKFMLMYTNKGSWDHFGMANITNAFRGPLWMRGDAEGLIDGLWEARYHPNGPLLPRPFQDWWAWQFGADTEMPGIFNDRGQPTTVDGNYINHGWEEVGPMLSGFINNGDDGDGDGDGDPDDGDFPGVDPLIVAEIMRRGIAKGRKQAFDEAIDVMQALQDD